MLKIRRFHNRLIFNMEIAILGKDGLYIETGPRSDGLHTSGECSKLFSKCYQISTWKLVFSLSRVHNILSSWFTRPTSHSYPRCGQLTRHSLILANGLIRQSLTAVVHLCWNQWHKLKCDKWSGGWSTGTVDWLSASEPGQYLDGCPVWNTKCLVPLPFLPDLILWSTENCSHGSPVLVPPETQ